MVMYIEPGPDWEAVQVSVTEEEAIIRQKKAALRHGYLYSDERRWKISLW